MKKIYFYLVAALLLTACGKQVPSDFKQSNQLPHIYPDYTNVTVPINIAPLTFQLEDTADEVVARFSVDGEEMICGGNQVVPDIDDWKQLAERAKGKAMTVEVYACNDGNWTKFKPFCIFVSPDSIDSYLSYRLIPPSYISYEALTLNQRCLENYDEQVMVNNMLCSTPESGQCVNCHHYQKYNPQRMQFHARQNHGGTVIAYDGKVWKVNMKNDSILSAGVYPAWHPFLNMIVYSTNNTYQAFHTIDPNKIEVFDIASDMIVYDVEKNEVTNIENDPNEFEVFPCWAPDGKTLYYCSAFLEVPDSVKGRGDYIVRSSRHIRYNIYRKSFDPTTRQFGPRELVFDAAVQNMSATLPRVSPDGRFLMFTMGKYGVFHIWHHDADLWLMDLTTGETHPMKEINSNDTESYHTWSSNGRWVVFSSRRDDGNFTRPFFAHIDKNGKGTKPFELPSADPDYHRQFMKCYNIPEFMTGPVTIKPQEFADVLKGDGKPPVTYHSQKK